MYIPTLNSDAIIPGVSESLRKFICAYVPHLSEGAVTFDSPAELEGNHENRLALYLYQIERNPFLLNSPATLTLLQDTPNRRPSLALAPAPLMVDLLYMVVAYGTSGEYEQMIANGVVSLLDSTGVVPDEYLVPVLKESGNDSLSIIPQAATIHTLRDLWAAFSNKNYRLTRLYTVPSVRISQPTTVAVDMTVQTNLRVSSPSKEPFE